MVCGLLCQYNSFFAQVLVCYIEGMEEFYQASFSVAAFMIS